MLLSRLPWRVASRHWPEASSHEAAQWQWSTYGSNSSFQTVQPHCSNGKTRSPIIGIAHSDPDHCICHHRPVAGRSDPASIKTSASQTLYTLRCHFIHRNLFMNYLPYVSTIVT